MSEPSQTGRETAPAPPIQMVGSDDAPVCEDGVCAVPTTVAAAVTNAGRAGVEEGPTA